MKKIWFILLTLVPFGLSAQEIVFQREIYPFPITFYGMEPHFGFTDASAWYHHGFGDVDNDGDFDIIIGTSFGQEYFAENIGTAEEADFQLITNQYVIPDGNSVIYPPTFADIDNDDDLDIFIGSVSGYVLFYRNIGTPDSAVYDMESNDYLDYLLRSSPTIVLADIDKDGDLDFFAGSRLSYFDQIYFFRNEGTPDSADFVFVTDNFAGIIADDFTIPEFCDIDDDGDLDLFIGGEEGRIWYYENIGDSVNYNFEYVTNNYDVIFTGLISVPRFCDIDNDGDYDLFVANAGSEDNDGFVGDIAFFENTGSPAEPEFTFVTGDYLWIELSGRSSPAFIDIDADNSTELMVAIGPGQIVRFDNMGTATEPNYAFTDSASLDGFYAHYAPKIVFGDLDSDNDYDLLAGTGSYSDAYLKFYFNQGTPQYPVFSTNFDRRWDFPETPYHFPELCDIDGDSDLDLFFGNGPSALKYYENIGDPYNPNFQLITEDYLNTSYPYGGGLCPRFSDLDMDGDYDLILATSFPSGTSNYITYWRNDGTPDSASFVMVDTIDIYEAAEVLHLSLELYDIDNDGDDDLFVGEGSGGMLFYRNISEVHAVNGKPGTTNLNFALLPNYPNPFNAVTTIPFTLDQKLPVKIVVYNQLGQMVETLLDRKLDSGNHHVYWDAGGVSSGVYLIRLDTQAGYSESRKVMLVK